MQSVPGQQETRMTQEIIAVSSDPGKGGDKGLICSGKAHCSPTKAKHTVQF